MSEENNEKTHIQVRSSGPQLTLATIVGIVGVIATVLTAWGSTSTRISLLENHKDALIDTNKILVQKIEDITKSHQVHLFNDQEHDHDNELKIQEINNRLNLLEKKK